MDKYFTKIIPKSVILPSVVMKISFRNTKKKSIIRVLVEQESDIDKARKKFQDKYKNHNADSIEDITLSLDQRRGPLIENGSVDFNDEEELDNIFFVFKMEYNEFKNGYQE